MSNIIYRSRTPYVITVDVVGLLIKNSYGWISNKSICILADIDSRLYIKAKHPDGWTGEIAISHKAGSNVLEVYYPDSKETYLVEIPPLVVYADSTVYTPDYQVTYPNGSLMDTVAAELTTNAIVTESMSSPLLNDDKFLNFKV